MTSTRRDSAITLFRAAVSALVAGKDTARARTWFEQAIRVDSTYAAPRYNLGVLAEANEDWEHAIRWFEEFTRAEPASPYAARAYAEISHLRRVREEDKTPEGRRRRRYDDAIARVRLFLNAGHLKQASLEASVAASIDSTRWEAYALAGSALLSQHDFGGAATFLRRAVAHAPMAKRAALERAAALCDKELAYRAAGKAGTLALDQRDYAEAAAQFAKAATLFPDRPRYVVAAASAYELAGDPREATRYASAAVGSSDTVSSRVAGEILRRLAKYRTIDPPIDRGEQAARATRIQRAPLDTALALLHEDLAVAKVDAARGEYRDALALLTGARSNVEAVVSRFPQSTKARTLRGSITESIVETQRSCDAEATIAHKRGGQAPACK